jgi:phosphatidylinositol dimannoside acyltransferase
VAGHQRRILRHVLGHEPDAAAVDRATTEVFRNVGRAWIDTARAHRSSRAEVEATMRVEGWPHVVAALNEGRPVIMAMAHIGAWDRGGVWLSRRIPLSVVAERLEPPEVFDWFVRERTAAGMRVIGLDQHTGATLLAELRSGRSIGLLCDRDLTGDGVPVSFFGAKTTLPGGPAVLALRTGAVILPCAVYLTEGAVCRAVIRPPVVAERTSTGAGSLRRDVERVTAAVALELEHLIAAAPSARLLE